MHPVRRHHEIIQHKVHTSETIYIARCFIYLVKDLPNMNFFYVNNTLNLQINCMEKANLQLINKSS